MCFWQLRLPTSLFWSRGTENTGFSKPLIILGLIIYFYQVTRSITSTLLTKSMLAALIFSWIGDILLMWDKLFVFGLGFFLMAHVCYIIAFRLAQNAPIRIGKVNFIRSFSIIFQSTSPPQSLFTWSIPISVASRFRWSPISWSL